MLPKKKKTNLKIIMNEIWQMLPPNHLPKFTYNPTKITQRNKISKEKEEETRLRAPVWA
jgi:hypothetical protein